MKFPDEGELTSIEQAVYDLVSDCELAVIPTTKQLARVLQKDEALVAGVLDGLEAMGFVYRRGGMWHPDYTD